MSPHTTVYYGCINCKTQAKIQFHCWYGLVKPYLSKRCDKAANLAYIRFCDIPFYNQNCNEVRLERLLR